MAKKADLLKEAKDLGLNVNEKNTIAQIELAISEAKTEIEPIAEVVVKKEEALVEVEKEVTAKAGKRSAKSLAEAEAKAEKEARKEAGDTTPQEGAEEAAIKKGPKPVTRPLIERRGKAYQKAAKEIEANKYYTIDEAIEKAKKVA